MSTTPNQKDLLAKKSDLEGILKPDDNDVLHLPDVTITLAESGQFYLAGIDKKLLTLVGNTRGNAVALDGDAGLTFTTSEGSSTITGITSSSGNSTSLAASQSMASAKQDKIIAGTNITIAQDGKTISATDTNELENLTDVNITTPTDGQGLVYNNTTQKWENGTVSSASSIDTLTDVNLTNLTNGQILKYNSTSQEWENANESGGGSGSTVTITPTLATGTKIADYSIDGVNGELYAPNGGGGGGSGDSFITYSKSVTTTYYGWWVVEDENGNTLDPDTYVIIDISVNVRYYDVLWYQDSAGDYRATLFDINDGNTIRSSSTRTWTITYAKKDFSGGGTDVTELTQSEYNALPEAEKNNGCIYMVSSQASTPEELTEAQTNTSTAVTASSYAYDTNLNQYHYPWCAFNRVSPNPNEMAYPTPGVTTQTCWSPNVSQDGSNSWICYHFDRAYKMTSMIINSFTDYSSSATKSMIIEGSNDGTTWTNILLTGNSFSLNSDLHTLTPNNVNLNSDTAYEYVRLRSLEPMGASYQPSVFIDEIFVYGYNSEKALKKIYYMGTEYGNTGGGSSVTPNPQGTPTDTLSTIEIDGTIYNIEGSGEGGSTFEGLDYANKISLNIPDATGYTYTPTENGALLLTGYGSASVICESTSELLNLKPYGDTYSTVWVFIEKNVTYTIKKGGGSGSSFGSGSVLYFIPLKNSSSGGGGTSVTTLFENNGTTSPASITLEDDLTNYDIVLFQLGATSGDAIFTMAYNVADLTVGDTIGAGSATNIFVWYYYTNSTTLTLRVSAGNVYMSTIVGIKLGGGGSSVTPNPTGTPTDTLDTVSIDGTIYEIQGGGGSGTYTSTLLNDGTAVQDVLTLSSDYTNFDELLITWMYDNNLYITTLKLNTSDISINDTITLDDYQTRDMVLTVTSTTAFTITSQASGMGILSIRGLTYSKTAKEKSRDVLWTTGSWTMAHPITDYDEIIFKWGSTHSTCFIPSDIMTYKSFIVIDPDTNNFMWFDVTDASTFTVHQNNNLTITSIDGVVYTKDEPVVFADEMTLDEYNALTTAQKNDGTIRFIPKNPYGIITDVDMSTITNLSDSAITVTPSADEIEMDFDHNDSYRVGGTFYISAPINVTNYDYLKYDLTTGVCYNSLHSDTNPLRNLGIGLCQNAPSTWQYCPNVNWAVSKIYDVNDVNSTFTDEVIDVSELTGTYYFVVAFVAWEATISNLKFATAGGYPSQIKYMDKTYGISSGGGGSGYTEEVIYSATPTTAAPNTLTLTKPYTDFDMLLFNLYRSADGVMNKYDRVVLTSKLSLNDRIQLITYDEWASYDITTTTSFTLINEDSMYIGSVVGLKFGGGSGGGGSSEVTYSTTEHKVGTWIDGSDIYEKTIILRENGTDNYIYLDSIFSQSLPANINWINIESFYAKRGSGGWVDCMNNQQETILVPNPTTQGIYFYSQMSHTDIIVTIRYTKTT